MVNSIDTGCLLLFITLLNGQTGKTKKKVFVSLSNDFAAHVLVRPKCSLLCVIDIHTGVLVPPEEDCYV